MKCRFCDAALEEGSRFCQSCGARQEPERVMPSEVASAPTRAQSPWGSPAAYAPTAAQPLPDSRNALGEPQQPAPRPAESDALYIDPIRISCLVLLSAGFYSFYWMFITWKQLKQETGEDHHAIWHAIAADVPIYGLFRTHKHVEVVRDLSIRAGLVPGLIPIIFALVFGMGPWLVVLATAAAPEGMGTISLLLIRLVGLGFNVALLIWAQSDLNDYWWQTRGDRLSETPLSSWEIAMTLAGVLSWLTYLS